MEIVRIFASNNLEDIVEKGGLFAIRYSKGLEDEYERNFGFWFNASEVLKYLTINQSYLADDYFKKYYKSVDEIQQQIEDEAYNLEEFFLGLEDSNFEDSENILEQVFKPLINKESYGTELQKSKAPDLLVNRKKPLIRLYAIRIHKNLFIITGGAIKLVAQMGEHDDTDEELCKLDKVRDFLKTKGLTTADDLIYYYENNE